MSMPVIHGVQASKPHLRRARTNALLQKSMELLRDNLSQVYGYLNDPTVQEVMINDPDNIFIERQGQYERLELSIDEDILASAITLIANINKKDVKEVLDCRLPGLRVAATLPPIAVHGPSLSIRRHASRVFELQDYESSGAFDARQVIHLPSSGSLMRPSAEEVAAGAQGVSKFLRWMVNARVNFIVSGSTSSGKTALLNSAAALIAPVDRVITIEDTAELQLPVPNWVSFESNSAYGVSIRDLVRHTLRCRPNRIWVGEIRGAEAFDMLDAYTTGHAGSAVSFHSDSASASLYRLENMVRMAPEAANWPLADLRRQISSVFRFVLHASNVHGRRGPTEIIEVLPCENGEYRTNTLFKKEFEFVFDPITPQPHSAQAA